MPVVQEHTFTIKQDQRLVKIVLQERTKTKPGKHRAKHAVLVNIRQIAQPIVLYAVPVHIRQKPVEQLIATKVVVPAPTSMIPTMRPNTTKLPIALHAVPVHIPQL